MGDFLCHNCAIQAGLGKPSSIGNVTGTHYQLKKFFKHTIPPSGHNLPLSVLDDPSIENYVGHMTSALASGAIEIDNRGRKSLVYTPSKRVGATSFSGGYKRPDSAIRVVRTDNPHRIHLYSTASEQIVNGRCGKCGGPLTS